MLTSISNPSPLIKNPPPQKPNPPPQMHNLTLNPTDTPRLHRSQISTIQRSRNMSRIPKSLFRDRANSHGGADIEDEGDGATVQVSGGVAEGWDTVEGEDCCGGLGVGWGDGC